MNRHINLNPITSVFTTLFLLFCLHSYGQGIISSKESKGDKFRYIQIKPHFGSFLKSTDVLNESGLLDNGYGGVTIKYGWQSSNNESWVSRYGYPSYGIGIYSGFLSDAEVFGNPNAIYGFIKFPFSDPSRRNIFALETSFGLTYKLKPYDSETNPVNEAIGARAAVYFNIDFGFTYKWTRELDLLYGIDFTHFSNGSTYKPNAGLNLYGINFGLRYNYNAAQSTNEENLYSNNVLPARFRRPNSSALKKIRGSAISILIAGGTAQSEALKGTETLMGVFSGIIDYEYQINEMHAVTGGFDIFYDNRLQNQTASDRWSVGVHGGYDFRFYKFAVKMQFGTYLGDNNDKGEFFMRPALRYNFSKRIFAQIGLKTLNGGAADYIEYGIGFRPFSW
ncbi:acyloxyacyl hydrolase [Aequorivita xiaoshiensis]|uniref:Acyloxyacyl hydrolase n=1 Tax=Aequorivita xiaoshiensis TaxID=2874476 RepID=A0A9X1U401_9FLAO|nr:acyloxyacyl hydrolase [Aequorivita xiaoshiensis]MCG2430320.1 acyloxyacyl hydrolase [Aequorivita xiaoshiensis]